MDQMINRQNSIEGWFYIGIVKLFVVIINLSPGTLFADDFSTRCAANGVVKCWGFDALSDTVVSTKSAAGDTIEVSGFRDAYIYTGGRRTEDQCENGVCKIIDPVTKASGAGSLRMEIPSNSPANSSGSWFGNFSDDLSVQFGEGETFYVQFRQRFSEYMLNHTYKTTAGAGGWKMIIIGAGDTGALAEQRFSSCTNYEIVMNNYAYRRIPFAYWGCGTGGELSEAFGPSDFKLQNKWVNPVEPNYCLYSTHRDELRKPNGWRPGTGASLPGCYPFYPNEWMTFQVKVSIGHWGQNDSHVEIWAAREGQASTLLISRSLKIYSEKNVAGVTGRYGKIWLLPYNTNKDNRENHEVAYTWYDELIVSRNKIADPTGGVTLPPDIQAKPSPPTNISVQ